MSNYKFITDAGHGWLSVPLEDIRKLGIADQISRYSYLTHDGPTWRKTLMLVYSLKQQG
jgi:hypothetical protein